jgi:hypothetical protein
MDRRSEEAESQESSLGETHDGFQIIVLRNNNERYTVHCLYEESHEPLLHCGGSAERQAGRSISSRILDVAQGHLLRSANHNNDLVTAL